jgi:Transcriptional regulatory protein, C terminal
MASPNRDQIRQTLRKMARTHSMAIALLEQTLSVLQLGSELDEYVNGTSDESGRIDSAQSRPIIDRTMLSVVYRGKSCFLGNTLPLKLFERLVHRPNQYLSYDFLMNEIWHGTRTNDAVRSVVKTLRQKLRRAGMPDLAAAIDGRSAGHYRLMLNDRW